MFQQHHGVQAVLVIAVCMGANSKNMCIAPYAYEPHGFGQV
jgi:hypothetical protein